MRFKKQCLIMAPPASSVAPAKTRDKIGRKSRSSLSVTSALLAVVATVCNKFTSGFGGACTVVSRDEIRWTGLPFLLWSMQGELVASSLGPVVLRQQWRRFRYSIDSGGRLDVIKSGIIFFFGSWILRGRCRRQFLTACVDTILWL